MVTVKATGGGEIVGITIDPKAIDPDDPEMLADLVLAAVNEALRSGEALMESKMQGMLPGGARRPRLARVLLVQDARLGRRMEAAPGGEIEIQVAPRDRRVGDSRQLDLNHGAVDAGRLASRPPEKLDQVLDERGIAHPHLHGDPLSLETSPRA